MFGLRKEIPAWQAAICALACVAVCFGGWWYVTAGEPEERIYSPLILPSPRETFAAFNRLWSQDRLAANALVSLRRVVVGFGLAALVGVPLGVLCGCFSRVNAFFSPLTVFGRNVPMAALIPLTFALFGGTTEKQKYMFIFLSCVAFVVADSAGAIRDIGSQYIDTAFTLGASRRQTILKVLVPLALPSIFNSLRLLFGLAFGYIMLAELVTSGDKAGGLGYILNLAQGRGANRPYIMLIILIIPALALTIDRVLYLIQRQLFPYRYGSRGYLHRAVCAFFRSWEDLKSVFWTSSPAAFPAPAAKESETTP